MKLQLETPEEKQERLKRTQERRKLLKAKRDAIDFQLSQVIKLQNEQNMKIKSECCSVEIKSENLDPLAIEN